MPKYSKDWPATIGLAKNMFFSRGPGYLIYFVTHRCNANCDHCFDWQQRKNIKEAEELNLKEIGSFAEKLPAIGHLSLTGGEPFLRPDLPEIVKLFYEKSKVRSFSIPTNGSRPEQIERAMKNILENAPQARFIVTLSVDAIGEQHDRIRGLEGLFKKVVETYERLEKIQRQYPQLQLTACLTLSSLNEDVAERAVDYLAKWKLEQIEVTLLRGRPSREVQEAEPEQALRIIEKINKINSQRKGQSLLARLTNILNYQTNLIGLSQGRWPCGPCLAGKRLLVIRANGDVLPCEIIQEIPSKIKGPNNGYFMGNLKDHKYDLNGLLKSEQARQVKRMLKQKKCHCSFECAITATLVFRFWTLLKVVLINSIRKKIGKQ